MSWQVDNACANPAVKVSPAPIASTLPLYFIELICL
jgi:hypothetical protein